MKMAKAGTHDLRMAMELSNAIEGMLGFYPAMPKAVAKDTDEDRTECFDSDDREQCVRALGHLLELAESASLMRVVWGCAVMLDPANKCVDPDADTIEHHPDALAGHEAKIPQPLADWREDIGEVLWWRFPISEAPYVGTPGDSDWPGYHTHWTRIICPEAPSGEIDVEAQREAHRSAVPADGRQWSSGYYCAVALLLRNEGMVTPAIRELFDAGGGHEHTDPGDVETFRAHGLIAARPRAEDS